MLKRELIIITACNILTWRNIQTLARTNAHSFRIWRAPPAILFKKIRLCYSTCLNDTISMQEFINNIRLIIGNEEFSHQLIDLFVRGRIRQDEDYLWSKCVTEDEFSLIGNKSNWNYYNFQFMSFQAEQSFVCIRFVAKFGRSNFRFK